MPRSSAGLRGLLRTLHRWLGVALLLLIVPVSLSGAVLVFHDEIEAALHPARYRVSGGAALPISAYVAAGRNALDGNAIVANVRLPERDGSPVTLQARRMGSENTPPQLFTLYLDPASARVLDVVDFRSSLMGFLHRFHENLTVPQHGGRAIVGWTGVGLFCLALSGLVLWWPRTTSLLRALRWRRRPTRSANLHFVFGFWISLPLAFVALTGIYLAFPPQARTLMSIVADMRPAGPRGFAAPIPRPVLGPDRVLEAGQTAIPNARPVTLFFPISARANGADTRPVWRIQLKGKSGDTITVLVDDHSGTARRQPAPLAGDHAAQWIRWLHEGSHGGLAWRLVVFLTGLLPVGLGLTGLIMWLSGRRRRAAASRSITRLQAAE